MKVEDANQLLLKSMQRYRCEFLAFDPLEVELKGSQL